MQWTDTTAEYKQLGQTWKVLRPAFVLELYGDGTQMVDHGEAILERFLGMIPTGTSLHQLGNNAREYTEMDTRSLNRIKKTLRELDKAPRFYSIKDAPEFSVGQYSIELNLGSEEPTINDSVMIALPLEHADEKHLPQILEFFAGMAKDFPFWAGVAGYGFDIVWGREFEMVGMPAMLRSALRFHGLLVRHRDQESECPKMLKSAGWLTFLDKELIQSAGGPNTLRAALDKKVQITPIREGMILKAGNRPPVGDINRKDKDILPLASVNCAISKIRSDTWVTHNLFSVSAETANGWFSRFDE